MDKAAFFRKEASGCREAAAGAESMDARRALLQLAGHYEREARREAQPQDEAPSRRPSGLGT